MIVDNLIDDDIGRLFVPFGLSDAEHVQRSVMCSQIREANRILRSH